MLFRSLTFLFGITHYLALALTLIILDVSVIQSNLLFRSAGTARTFLGGNNNLIERAEIVQTVRTNLLRNLPNPTSGSIILLGDVDLWAFSGSSGPRVWYLNPTLRVFPLKNLRIRNGEFFLDQLFLSQADTYTGNFSNKLSLNTKIVVGYRKRGNLLEKIEPKELEQIAIQQSM